MRSRLAWTDIVTLSDVAERIDPHGDTRLMPAFDSQLAMQDMDIWVKRRLGGADSKMLNWNVYKLNKFFSVVAFLLGTHTVCSSRSFEVLSHLCVFRVCWEAVTYTWHGQQNIKFRVEFAVMNSPTGSKTKACWVIADSSVLYMYMYMYRYSTACCLLSIELTN